MNQGEVIGPMLDKSLPYYNVIMKRKQGITVPEAILPEGFSYVDYREGDEAYWAEIEASVGEFDTINEASDYFSKKYLPYQEELKRRLFFIETISGEKVATLTNWWDYTGNRRDPSMHWVGVRPEFQGLGLGKAIVNEGMKRMIEIEGDRDFFLHTQTWSYKAINVYLKAGYELVRNESFGNYGNDYDQAIAALGDRINI